ncbi:unnamed protein product [Arabidopsis halleri]
MTHDKSCCIRLRLALKEPALVVAVCFLLIMVVYLWGAYDYFLKETRPKVTIASMNFTITEIPTSAKWDLLIRTPRNLPGYYICLEGDLQAFLIYKHVVVATSVPQRYQNLKPNWPHLLKVSVVASEKDINGTNEKKNLDDIVIKEMAEVRMVFPDCREKTTGIMSFACDEVVLQFDSSSQTMTMPTSKNPTCHLS